MMVVGAPGPGGGGAHSHNDGPPASRILVVDDNDDAAQMLAALLRGYGNEAETAGDASEALAVSERFVPQIAFVDIGLPGTDGYALCRLLRQQSRSLRVIALTGYGQESDRIRSREAGFERHIVKPITTAQIKEILADVRG